VIELAETLSGFAKKDFPQAAGEREALWQTDAADVVDRVFAFLGGKVHPRTVLDLRNEVVRVSDALRHAPDEKDLDTLAALRDVCVAISRAAQVHDPVPVYGRPGTDA
jgi:hypothetical protein